MKAYRVGIECLAKKDGYFMLDQNIFTETVREVSEIIRTAAEPLSREEILGYFDKMELNEAQQEMVLEYLLKSAEAKDSEGSEETGDEELLEADGDGKEDAVADTADMPGKSVTGAELPDSQALRLYMEEIEGLSVYAQEALQKLYEELLKGDASVISQISESWMGKILERAKKLTVAPEDFQDVVQEGNMALFMKLSELCGRGVQNGHQAGTGNGSDADRAMAAVFVEKEIVENVEAAMKNYIQTMAGEDDVENAVVGKVTLVNEARRHLMEENGQEPSLRELAAYTKMAQNELRDMLDFIEKAEQREKDRG